MKVKTSFPNASSGSFRSHIAHSPEEVLAAGGASAFAKKTDKNNAKLIQALNDASAPEPFKSGEWEDLISQLEETK